MSSDKVSLYCALLYRGLALRDKILNKMAIPQKGCESGTVLLRSSFTIENYLFDYLLCNRQENFYYMVV